MNDWTTIFIILLIYATFFALWMYNRRREKRGASADGTFIDTLDGKKQQLSAALAQLNVVDGTWRDDNDNNRHKAAMQFTFQGGNFNLEIDSQRNTAGIIFPYFYSHTITDIMSLRTFLNKVNQSCALAHVIYSCDTERAEADLHIVASLVITTSLNGKVMLQYLDDIFMCRNIVLGEVEEARRYNRKVGLDDMEQSYVKYEYENHLLFEGALQLQEKPHGAHYNEQSRPLLGDMLREALDLVPPLPTGLTVTRGDSTVETVAADKALGYDLSQAVIRDRRFMGGTATLLFTYKEKESDKRARTVTVTLQPRQSSDETLGMRAVMTLAPCSVQPIYPANSDETLPHSIAFNMGYDLVDEPQIKAKFRYLWKEVAAIKKEGGAYPDDYYMGLIYDSFCQDEAFFHYRGAQLFFAQRYAEALPWLRNAREMLRRLPKEELVNNAYNYIDLCYLIGGCYYVLRQFDRACYYLGLTAYARKTHYTLDFVNALIMADDPRAMSMIDNYIGEMESVLAQHDDDDEEDEDAEGMDGEYSYAPNKLIAQLNFMKCSKAHLLAEDDDFETAEKILRDILAKCPNDKKATDELKFLRDRKKRKEDQELNDMIYGNSSKQ